MMTQHFAHCVFHRQPTGHNSGRALPRGMCQLDTYWSTGGFIEDRFCGIERLTFGMRNAVMCFMAERVDLMLRDAARTRLLRGSLAPIGGWIKNQDLNKPGARMPARVPGQQDMVLGQRLGESNDRGIRPSPGGCS